ncbi:endonuclease/exonuclease/phosphatase family protein [Teredinibacter sp. KSP-S5-2]|uniref:endonuclease/exonuclease/phosphatase family protein n=1 Tax=Teredinibacter sp. KSP-S5-2 TaxID=3034506 RepID=UPI002934F47D|nr:endonuclease/exonuclease/phosphatase family protein [Teredinibacter sp. KSP-S5-2]WNO10242.1 endonuclease/exonuclease/phosphatase family protein [Teredinibacter sp. KSP-S5-2]
MNRFIQAFPFGSLLIFGVVATFLVSVATLFDGSHRYLELLVHFKLQYFLVSLFLLSWALLKKSKLLAVLMVCCVLVNGWFVMPWYITGAVAQEVGVKQSVRLLHSNVLSQNQNHEQLLALVESEKPQVIIVQEVTDNWVAALKTLSSNYPYSYEVPRMDNFGIALYSQYPIVQVQRENWGYMGLPSINATLNIAGQNVTLLSTHPLPPTTKDYFDSRNAQLNDMVTDIKQIEGPLLVVGDFNITMWSRYYRPLEENTGLRNVRRGMGILPTWSTKLPLAQIPIDHCLVSDHFEVQKARLGPNIGSDHLPLIVDLFIDRS